MKLTVQNQDTKEALIDRTVAVLHRNGLKRAGKGTLTALNARVITLGLPVGKTQGAAPIGKDAPTTTTSQGEQRLAGGALAASLSNRVQNLLRASTPPTGEAKHHADAREEARKKYESAMQAAALVALHNRKMKQHELEAAILLLLLLTGEDSYIKVHNTLGDGGVAGGRAADQTQVLEQAQTFAQGRQPALKEFAQKFAEQVRETIKQAESEGNDPATMARELRRVSDNTSSTMAATEAQITYGSIMLDRLARAGFKYKAWQTCDDEKVRDTHRECEEQGAIKMDKPFANGLQYPGDPNGPINELANCRCWLIGVGR